ncbi:MAG: chemotaxis response regulator protein-glutamate methylesterase [Planctomycetaceae bacterium]
MIVDDSAVVRGLLARSLEPEPDITVVSTAMHGQMALKRLKTEPVEVVILDVEMPVMDGLETLNRIQQDFPAVRVIMASTLTCKGAETTVRALSLGAAACVAKPTAENLAASIKQLRKELIPLVRAIGGKSQSPAETPEDSAFITRNTRPGPPRVPPQLIVIGSSTGGPNALKTVLTGLPTDFAVPIAIVQHMPPHFTAMLAKHIAQDTGRECREVVHGQPIQRGNTYVAPGDYHFLIDKQGDRMVAVVNQDPPEHFCRPSVNPLFRSASEWYRTSVLGVVLTGMGDDGIEGAGALVEQGGCVIAQDEASSVVWGMPGAVARAGLAHRVLPLDAVAGTILEFCQRKSAIPA